MPIIIDGYNLIFTCGLEGSTRTPRSLEKARARLISTLARHFSAENRSEITIVFDAQRLPIKEAETESRVDGIRVIYAVGYEDADTLIEELIRKHATPKKLTIVSSDHRIQTTASRRKAIAIDSDAWWDQLQNSGIPRTSKSECNTQGQSTLVSQVDLDKQRSIESLESVDWGNVFGQLSDPNLQPAGDTNHDGQNKVRDEPLNPFPTGYADDLLDDEVDLA